MGKKVFVVTWFQSENFGTCLQAYALHKILSDNGFEVTFLGRRKYYPINKWNHVVRKVLNIFCDKLQHCKDTEFRIESVAYHKKIQKINNFTQKLYRIKNIDSAYDIRAIDKEFSCYLLGSDQMWNPWMLRPQYLLDFVPAKSRKPKFSYAASFGVDNIPENKRKLYKKYLPLFNEITVREPRAAELVNELAGCAAAVVLDPTLLLLADQWRLFAKQSTTIEDNNISENYILSYFIGSEKFDHLTNVKKIGNTINAELILLPTKEKDYTEKDVKLIVDACAYDFVDLINNATLICTDSFHAVIFSFLLNRPFYYFPRFKEGFEYSQEARLKNIINRFCLADSFWGDNMSNDQIIGHLNCDYSKGYIRLQQERKRSIDILLSMLSSCQEE